MIAVPGKGVSVKAGPQILDSGSGRDDETELDYFGARYLDPMLGMWTSVDPMRQFASPYLYAGNGMNPVNVVDPDGNYNIYKFGDRYNFWFSSRGETFFFQHLIITCTI